MTFTRILTNVCSDRLPESRDFYVALLGFEVNYDSDWYVQLRCPTNHELEFGIISRTSDLVPAQFQNSPTGMYITFVVPDVDSVYSKAVSMGLSIVQAPKNEFYGQRRFLTVDPSGCLIDVCTPWSEAEK
jgi:catechol 2,3-dioxygenase-like lactoylglutathione lyase family enzyme